jgi:exopolysaccharide biosynthesis polyprenyl glycosylphosphotransferase
VLPANPVSAGSPLASVGELMRREHRYRVSLALADVLAVVVAVVAVPAVLGLGRSPLAFGLAPVLMIIVAKVQGLYDRDDRVVRKSTLGEWRRIVEAAAIVSVAVTVSWRLANAGQREGGLWLLLLLAAWTAAAMTIGRVLARRIAAALEPAEKCLIVGGTEGAQELLPSLASLRAVEVVGEVPMTPEGWSRGQLEQVIAHYHAHRLVLVSEAELSSSGMLETIRNGKEIGVRISIFPTLLASIGRSTVFDEVNGIPLLGLAPLGLSRSSRALKRAFDLLVAGAMLIVLSPLMALIALLIRLDSSGPVFFPQVRIGRDDRPFRMYKFRSMIDGAETNKPELLARNEAREGLFKIACDPRVTAVGRRIRRAHLDELPQLWNVLRGEMSLVGPRPLIEEEDRLFCGGDRCRLWLTPGMTGLWQIRGPLEAPLSEMARLDYLYISNWSLWRDVDILCKTALRVARHAGT